MKLDMKKIHYFLKVAETLNFSKAAQELYISTQALNKQIIQLEEELNVKLFLCSTRRVELTEAGEVLRKNFLPVHEEFGKACAKTESYLLSKKETIRIGFFQAISKKEVINPIIQYLKSLDQNMQVEVAAGELDEVNNWLMTERIDLSITNIHEFEKWDNINILPFMESAAQIVTSLFHPWVYKTEVTKSDLNEMPLILIKREKSLGEDEYCRNIKGKERKFVTNFNSMLANLELDNNFAVMPKLFESMKWSSLHYIDLPDGYKFYFKTVAMYLPGNRFEKHLANLQSITDKIRMESCERTI